MAILDSDLAYLERFSEYINRKEQFPFHASIFTTGAALAASCKESRFDLLLAGERVSKTEVEQTGIDMRMMLTETGISEWESRFPGIYKYQPMGEILKQITAGYWDEEEEAVLIEHGKGALITGIYSPVGRCGKTLFSIVLSRILSQDQSVLLISLDEHCMTGIFPDCEDNGDLSDALYYYRQDKNWIRKISSLYCQYDGFHFIPPVKVPVDLYTCTGRGIGDFLQQMGKNCGYEAVVVDIAAGGGNPVEILTVCDLIYMPVVKDSYGNGKIDAFEEYLEAAGKGVLLERIRKVNLPVPPVTAIGRDYPVGDLVFGELGSYIRHLVRGDPWKNESRL